METSLTNEPISTKNPAFLALTEKHLNNNEAIVVLIRYANSAGAKDYLFVRTKNELETLLNKQIPKTSITIFFESAFAIKGKADNDLIKIQKVYSPKNTASMKGLM